MRLEEERACFLMDFLGQTFLCVLAESETAAETGSRGRKGVD